LFGGIEQPRTRTLLGSQLQKGGAAREIRGSKIDERPPRAGRRVVVQDGVEA